MGNNLFFLIGYQLEINGSNCTDIDECADPQTCRRGECINIDGGYECKCPEDFELLQSGTIDCIALVFMLLHFLYLFPNNL